MRKTIADCAMYFGPEGYSIGGTYAQVPLNVADPEIKELEFQLCGVEDGVVDETLVQVIDSPNFSRESIVMTLSTSVPARRLKTSGKVLYLAVFGATTDPTRAYVVVRGLGD